MVELERGKMIHRLCTRVDNGSVCGNLQAFTEGVYEFKKSIRVDHDNRTEMVAKDAVQKLVVRFGNLFQETTNKVGRESQCEAVQTKSKQTNK